MRTAIALLAASGLVLSLAACSPAAVEDKNPTASTACKPAASGATSDGIEVSGKFGAKPTVKINGPLAPKTTERTVAIEGDGPVAGTDNQVMVQYTLYNATSGDVLSATEYVTGAETPFTLDEKQFLPGLVKTLACSSEGTRVVGVIPPVDSWGVGGSEQSAQLGVKPDDAIVFVADVIEVVPQVATGEAQATPGDLEKDGFPAVTLAKDGTPTVTVPKNDPPKDYQLAVLKKGTGTVVESGNTVTVQYQGINWRTGEVFDQSWGRGPASFQTTGVVKGFGDAMIGQPVGSQVIVIIPPALGYGPQGGNSQAGILKDDTLVFVIDILATN
ncbi:MAG: FKBP-type peptidyl-prolyl cis-trans isomerase [Microbacteriaceae bacterium]